MDRMQLGREFYELGLRLGRRGTVAIGSGGGSLARTLAWAVGCGVALAGGEAKFHDGGCAACGVWLAGYYDFPASVFVRQEGAEVSLFLSGEREKRFTPIAAQEPEAACTGEWDLLAGSDCAWAAHRAGDYQGELGPACAEGPKALTLALERLGYEVADRDLPGAVRFKTDPEGFSLQIEDGGGVFCPQGADALEGLADYVQRPQAVPAFRPEKNDKTQS